MQTYDHDHQSVCETEYLIELTDGTEINLGVNLTLKQAKAKVEAMYPGSIVYETDDELIEDCEYSDTTTYLVTMYDEASEEEKDFGKLFRFREYENDPIEDFDPEPRTLHLDDTPHPSVYSRDYWARLQ